MQSFELLDNCLSNYMEWHKWFYGRPVNSVHRKGMVLPQIAAAEGAYGEWLPCSAMQVLSKKELEVSTGFPVDPEIYWYWAQRRFAELEFFLGSQEKWLKISMLPVYETSDGPQFFSVFEIDDRIWLRIGTSEAYDGIDGSVFCSNEDGKIILMKDEDGKIVTLAKNIASLLKKAWWPSCPV